MSAELMEGRSYRTVPAWLDMDDQRVSAERLCDELSNYTSDIRRGIICPKLSFAEYVERYAGWKLVKQGDGV